MCTVCLLFNKGKLTIREAKAALNELYIDAEFPKDDLDHLSEVWVMLEKEELEE